MKFLNDFKNLFAIVGVVSIIFWTCASESTSDNSSSNLPPQITEGYGKYQVCNFNVSGVDNLVVLNTENGIMKMYTLESDDTFGAQEYQTLTVTH